MTFVIFTARVAYRVGDEEPHPSLSVDPVINDGVVAAHGMPHTTTAAGYEEGI